MARCQQRSSFSFLLNKTTKLFSLSSHKYIRQVGRRCQTKASCFPWALWKPRGLSAICTQSTGYLGPAAAPQCQTPTPACLWDRPKSQAAASPGLLKVLASEPAHRCVPCQHRQWLLPCAAGTLPTPSKTSKPAQPRIMEQHAAPNPRAAGRNALAPFLGK